MFMTEVNISVLLSEWFLVLHLFFLVIFFCARLPEHPQSCYLCSGPVWHICAQTLSSSKASDVADYAVGVLRGNLIHLNHIDAVMQMRPSMSHVNSGLKGNERSEDSKDYTEESEPWISLTYQPAGSNIASMYHAEMVSNEGGPIDFTMSISDYVSSLCPGGSTDSRGINKSQVIRKMLLLPLEERLKKWFTEVSQVNRFDTLMHLAPPYSDDDVLKVLPVYADLVCGLWVCKSSLLPDDGYACKRDRILLEFTKKIPSL
ncbi:hypothetical protein GUJ93_ZPchr0008g12041 [Zizania palustris]|uniref:Uncharacterized protein n=1 Tax=Zizania palustris TaxID=103762 RepID=A0A8J5VGN0_ZIZPA|nr:hypothetical protein GUJ93_ZPchr0008g12041 [Zizania palustris]